MGLLSQKQIRELLLLHRRHYVAKCDHCEYLLGAGVLYNVRKWKKRSDKLTFLGLIPTDIECLQCEGLRTGKLKLVDGIAVSKKEKVKEPPIGNFNSKVRKYTLRYIEESKDGMSGEELLIRLNRKSYFRDLTKKQIKGTWKVMKIKKELRKCKGKYILVTVKGKAHGR
jgi:hypothetical protein